MRLPPRFLHLVSPLRRRVRKMPTDQMLLWLDVAGSEMSRAFSEYLRAGDAADLAEFDRGVATLVALSDELHRRRQV